MRILTSPWLVFLFLISVLNCCAPKAGRTLPVEILGVSIGMPLADAEKVLSSSFIKADLKPGEKIGGQIPSFAYDSKDGLVSITVFPDASETNVRELLVAIGAVNQQVNPSDPEQGGNLAKQKEKSIRDAGLAKTQYGFSSPIFLGVTADEVATALGKPKEEPVSLGSFTRLVYGDSKVQYTLLALGEMDSPLSVAEIRYPAPVIERAL